MIQRLMLLGLLCGLLTAVTGCYGTCGPFMICKTNNCGPACQPGCSTECGGSCGSCADPCAPCGPLSVVAALLHPNTWNCGGCGGGGCGEEVYWGDFHGDPPECCDPCDRCGNFTGARADGCNDGSCGGSSGYPVEYSGGGGCSTCGTNSPTPHMSTAQAMKTYRPARR